MTFIFMLVTGSLIGLLSTPLVRTNRSITVNVITGITGSVIGNVLLSSIIGVRFDPYSLLTSLIVWILGAALLLFIVNNIRKVPQTVEQLTDQTLAVPNIKSQISKNITQVPLVTKAPDKVDSTQHTKPETMENDSDQLTKEQEIKTISDIINAHKRRLRVLQMQEAKQGVSVDPKILLEIEDIRTKINALNQELHDLGRN